MEKNMHEECYNIVCNDNNMFEKCASIVSKTLNETNLQTIGPEEDFSVNESMSTLLCLTTNIFYIYNNSVKSI